jgi:uncharacterized membrane protein
MLEPSLYPKRKKSKVWYEVSIILHFKVVNNYSDAINNNKKISCVFLVLSVIIYYAYHRNNLTCKVLIVPLTFNG